MLTRFVRLVACRRLASREVAKQLADYGEIVVSDVRAGLTIAQLVDDKLAVMLGNGTAILGLGLGEPDPPSMLERPCSASHKRSKWPRRRVFGPS